jgi:hypothetical protein
VGADAVISCGFGAGRPAKKFKQTSVIKVFILVFRCR